MTDTRPCIRIQFPAAEEFHNRGTDICARNNCSYIGVQDIMLWAPEMNKQRSKRLWGLAVSFKSVCLLHPRVSHCFSAHLEVYRLLAFDHSNEVTWDDASLMDELIERVLSICTWLSKINLTSFKRQPLSIHTYALAIALHGYLHEFIYVFRSCLARIAHISVEFLSYAVY